MVRADDSRLSDARTPVAHNHALTDANITGTLTIAKGGTGATAAPDARTNLGIGTAGEKAIADFASSTQGAAEKVTTLSGTTGSVTANLAAASVFTVAPTGNISPTFTNTPASGVSVTATLIVNQNATVRTVTLGGGVVWMTSEPTQAANKTCIFTFMTVTGGTTWYVWATVQP